MVSRIPFFRSQSSTLPPVTPISLPLDVPIEEEQFPEYHPNHFYHANPGEILDGRFELKVKLGAGRTSTVWLAQNTSWRLLSSKPYVVIKICDNNAVDEDSQHELNISNHIASSAAGLQDLDFLRLVLESFEISGPHGKHLCLVFEPLREPIWLLRRRLGADKVKPEATYIFKHFIGNMLDGLSILHTKCHFVHTDLKLDNILVTIEDTSILDDFIQLQTEQPMPRKVFRDRTVYRSNNRFGPLKTEKFAAVWPKITDFGLARRGDQKEPLILPIQPILYTAPEVLLGTGWSYSADIWNFGLMIWGLLAGEDLFRAPVGENGRYSARHHLAEMVAMLGPIPKELIEREREMRRFSWAPEVLNHDGILCNNAASFYGGPFFDDSGRFVGNDLIPTGRDMKSMVMECIADDQVDLFLDFMFKMLCWLPERRATAEELRKHPWLIHSET